MFKEINYFIDNGYQNKSTVSVNPSDVVWFEALEANNENYCQLHLVNGDTMVIDKSYDQVKLFF